MRNLLLLFCFLLPIYVFAQPQSTYVTTGSSTLLIKSNPENTNSGIQPRYLEYEWLNGNLQTIDAKVISNVSFKYNMSEDKFVMKAEVNPLVVDRIYMEDKAFIYTSFFAKGIEKMGYFEVVSEGNTQLLLRYTVKVKPGREGAFGFEASQKVIKQHFIKFGDSPAYPITKDVNDILYAFPDKQDEVAKYIKDAKLNLSKESDLVKLIAYYNSLK